MTIDETLAMINGLDAQATGLMQEIIRALQDGNISLWEGMSLSARGLMASQAYLAAIQAHPNLKQAAWVLANSQRVLTATPPAELA